MSRRFECVLGTLPPTLLTYWIMKPFVPGYYHYYHQSSENTEIIKASTRSPRPLCLVPGFETEFPLLSIANHMHAPFSALTAFGGSWSPWPIPLNPSLVTKSPSYHHSSYVKRKNPLPTQTRQGG